MDDAAQVAWVLTGVLGLTLAAIWLARGGLRQRDEALELSYARVADATDVSPGTPLTRRSRLPAWMISTHGALAVLGLALWAYYVDHDGQEGTGVGALPPLAVALLLVVAVLGVLMVRRWRGDRARLGREGVAKAERPAEQRFPVVVVVVHGLLAVVTIALVTLTALGIGD